MDGLITDADLVARTFTVRGPDSFVMPLPAHLYADTRFTRIRTDFTRGTLELGLPGTQELAVVELAGGSSIAELRAGRPAMYLDQNKWSDLAAWRFGRRELPPAEAEAADTIVQMVAEGRLLLPISACHFVESAPQYGAVGDQLVSTVLAYSRGWQMRSPGRVRQNELLSLFTDGRAAAVPVVAPNAGIFHHDLERFLPPGGGPPEVARFSAEIADVLALYSTLSDAEPLVAEKTLAGVWANGYASVAAQLHADDASPMLTRRVIRDAMIQTHRDDVAAAALLAGVSDAASSLGARPDPMGRLPFLARELDLLYRRARDPRQKWEANDFFDVNYLCCAAGYVDVVVGERNTISYLRNVRSAPPGAVLARTLAEGVEGLESVIEGRGRPS